MLGSAAFIWAIHLGFTTSDFEYWAMLLHVLIGSQGIAIVVGLYLDGTSLNEESPADPS